jgi:cysteine synthase
MEHGILGQIGNTNIVSLQGNGEYELFAKLEGQNPSGSVKDRTALYMLNKAIERCEIKPGMRIIEASSGNMGISLAMVGKQKGFDVEVVMSEAMSEEREQLIKAYGAKLILSPAELGSKGAIEKAKAICNANPEMYWFSNQFHNSDNVDAHFYGIGQEIANYDITFDYIIAGMGTSGTLMGISKAISKTNLQTKLIGIMPSEGYKIQGIQHPEKDFTPNIYSSEALYRTVDVSIEEAIQGVQELSKSEGIFGGLSSGAAYFASQKTDIPIGSKVLILLPDKGERYLSLGVFAE